MNRTDIPICVAYEISGIGSGRRVGRRIGEGSDAHDRRRTDRHGLYGQMPRAGLDGRPRGVRRHADRSARHAVRGRGGARAAESRRVRLRSLDRRLARADRGPGRGGRFDHHPERLACADGDRGARSGQACVVRKADGAVARRFRAHGRGGARLGPRRHPRLQLHPEPGRPLHRQADQERRDRLPHPFSSRNGRGLHGRFRGALFLAQPGEFRLWRAR